jgi:hypothetical protein
MGELKKMWKQNNLFGEQLPMNEETPDLPPEHICTETCYTATEEKCTCRCGGAYHGLGNLNKHKEQRSMEAKA